ncbi:uncharacterized protein A1O9_02946 [Exophiala aquamarina CBS 119918]|uniref:Rhodopsin domain-containing protein n=1 Tax=Exophiala aquamarina CBS 119918 TaxID=1182545 RepID=A0A072Q0H3_9EURO|nr:uncharacterized protein A1O9_02946 [Exophiala aquamarina CBS 119918]KEF61380.1 hypothetical protein A1O9_02946 [Exophiala aquamarina CBS 119918]
MGLDRGMQAVVTASAFTGLALLFVVVRCISRFLVIKQAGTEDYFAIIAVLLSIGTTVTIGLQREYGLGRHADTVSTEDNEMLSKLLYASVIVYNLGLMFVKDSILYQYLRFFVARSYRRAAWGLIGIVTVGGIVMVVTSTVSCLPVPFYWDKTVEGGHCINLMAFWFAFSAFNIVTDLAVWLLPMPVLKNLQLPRKQKYSLIGVFALGGFGCITAILRLHALYIASISTDLTYDNVGAATWSSCELNVGIACSCIPALRPLISLIFPRLLTSTRRDHTSDPFSRGAAYYRNENESIVELSHVNKIESDASHDDTISLDTTHTPGAIRVKQEWTITEKGGP